MNRLSIETIEKWLDDSDWKVRNAAMLACQGRSDIPLETIEKWLDDSDCDVRNAAMLACQGRSDIPLETIEKWLDDSDCDVKAAALNVCKYNGIEIPIIRTIEPPDKVYKKCVGNVIVVAEIPQDAQVRGGIWGKCRASKAKIVDIIGDVRGEKVGISMYDNSVMYFIGDEVEIDNFDYSNEECSTGFHFFCTLGEAKNYN